MFWFIECLWSWVYEKKLLKSKVNVKIKEIENCVINCNNREFVWKFCLFIMIWW